MRIKLMTPTEAKNLLKYSDDCSVIIHPVGKECFRVNIYEKYKPDGSFFTLTRIIRSAYVCMTENGYKDFTLSK